MSIVQCIKTKVKGEGWKLLEVIQQTDDHLTCKEIDEGTLAIGPTRVIGLDMLSEGEVWVCWLDIMNLRKQMRMRSYDEG